MSDVAQPSDLNNWRGLRTIFALWTMWLSAADVAATRAGGPACRSARFFVNKADYFSTSTLSSFLPQRGRVEEFYDYFITYSKRIFICMIW